MTDNQRPDTLLTNMALGETWTSEVGVHSESYDDISIPWEELEHDLLRLPSPYVDDRGSIQPVIDRAVSSCVYITSNPGAIRGNHYHKGDWHYSYVVSGVMKYFSRPAGSTEKPDLLVVEAGQMIFTPPQVEHAMLFSESSAFLAFGSKTRQQEAYEADLVRVELINGSTVES